MAAHVLGYNTPIKEDHLISAAGGCIVRDENNDGGFEITYYNTIKGTPSKPNYKLICFKGRLIFFIHILDRFILTNPKYEQSMAFLTHCKFQEKIASLIKIQTGNVVLKSTHVG